MPNLIRKLTAVNWNTPGKRRWYFVIGLVALASLCGVGTSLQSAAHQDWQQVLKTLIVGLTPYLLALLKVALVFALFWLARGKATEFVKNLAAKLPEHNTLKGAIANNYHFIHWSLATVAAVYIVDKMLIAYVFFAIYAGYKLLSKYVDDMAAGFALVSTAKVTVNSEVTIETGITGTLLEVALFYSTVKIGDRLRKIQNSVLWQNWVETQQTVK